MMFKERRINIFIGRWKIISMYCINKQGWKLFKRYGNNSIIWEFTEKQKLEFSSGSVVCYGKLKEYFKDCPNEETDYVYYPSERRLCIERSNYEPDGFCSIYIEDMYRIEHICRNEYWLYDLEEVEKEPEDYRYRLKISRI